MTIAGAGSGQGRSGARSRLTAADVARPLLAWYARAGRDLPWRRSADPYRVWVSEIMLQQTQVERVKDFFGRFLVRFPDVAALAAADEAEVLRLWEGLGYYRRARQLHAAAKRIVADHGGCFPRTAAELRLLPGIGRYTAGAIASIAFDAPEPIVEANSRRVIARLVGHDGPLGGGPGDEPIWQVARMLVPRRHPGRFNQALMDLGAAVCTPLRPRCGICPVAAACVTRRDGRVDEIPRRAARHDATPVHETAVIASHAGRVLVVQRGAGEWWAGLWDFPRVPGRAARAARGIAASPTVGSLGCGMVERLGTVMHTVTHHRITLDVVRCRARRAGSRAANRRWVKPGRLASLAMPSPARRIARLLDG